MYCIEIPKGINNIMSAFYYVGLWHRGDKATVRETSIKWFYFLHYFLFPTSLFVGSIKNDGIDESIFSAEGTFAAVTMSLKLYYIIWRKDRIIEMLNRVGTYSIESREEFTLANDKLRRFIKFTIVLMFTTITAVVIPLFGKERTLFFNIGFPLDWKNNEIAFWLANAFIFTEVTLSLLTVLSSVFFWYLMISCALRYEILGMRIRNMGVRPTIETTVQLKTLVVEKQKFFLEDLIAAIDAHQHIGELIQNLESFLSNIFFMQIVTSGLCICGSTYCLAFGVGKNLLEQLIHLATLVYNVSEIFMIMYLGNEIKLSSDRLSYSLFESNWIDQPQETNKLIIVFSELLKEPHELVVGLLYPLTLETFTRILNFAYNTFNILKNFK